MASLLRHSLIIILHLLPRLIEAQRCTQNAVTDANYVPNQGYISCGQDSHFITEMSLHVGNSQPSAISSASQFCSSSLGDCSAFVVYQNSFYSGYTANYYASTPPTTWPAVTCTYNDGQLVGQPNDATLVVSETLTACFSSSTAQASEYCSSLLSDSSPPQTIYASTTITPSTVTVTSVLSSFATVTATGTTTGSITTSTLSATTSIVVVTAVRSTTFKVTKTVTSSVCKAMPRALEHRFTPALHQDSKRTLTITPTVISTTVPPPACLSNGGLSTPSSMITSACSCFYTGLSTGPITITVSTTTTASTPSTTIYTISAITSTASATTTLTTTMTQKLASTTTSTSTKFSTTTITTTTTTTTSVQKTSIPTFALYARLPSQPSKRYRLLSRFVPGSQQAPQDRIIQYRKPPAPAPFPNQPDYYTGANGTIINGELYILSRDLKNPKLYGVSLMLNQRYILGQQASGGGGGGGPSGLAGCMVDKSKGGVVSCKQNGKAVQFQELSWGAGKESAGKFMAALIPAGANVKNYQPVVELVAQDFGVVQVGCA